MATFSRAFHKPGPPAPRTVWSDDRLVHECLKGNEAAWAALVDKYKGLIFSIPLKYGASREDAADVFQAVCLELFSELSHLRRSGALRSWLITVTARKSLHWKQKQSRRSEKEVSELAAEDLDGDLGVPADVILEAERDQMVREAVAQLPVRCAEMVRLLFYRDPPVPYQEVAQRLGLATGSIGFIRGRCLGRLQKLLKDRGF